MAKRFSAQLAAQTQLARRRMNAVFKQSAQEVIAEAQKPRAKGGNMPVKTGFLRNSGRVGLGEMPTGPIRGKDGREYDWEDDPEGQAEAVATINSAPPGVSIFFGWAANYARFMEARYQFLGLAAQNWTKIVSKNVARAKATIR